jgi:hypothetical protein
MTRLTEDEFLRLVRGGLSPAHHNPPDTDLWLNVRDRIERGAPLPTVSDWVLTFAVVALCVIQPAVFGVLLLHL